MQGEEVWLYFLAEPPLHFGIKFLFLNPIVSIMDYGVIKLPNNFRMENYTNFGYFGVRRHYFKLRRVLI